MKKFYYINLAATPFAKVYETDAKIENLPKYWKEIDCEQAKNYNVQKMENA